MTIGLQGLISLQKDLGLALGKGRNLLKTAKSSTFLQP